MTLEIDTVFKSIKVKGQCSAKELFDWLNNAFSDFEWESWTITQYPNPQANRWEQPSQHPATGFGGLVLPYTQPYIGDQLKGITTSGNVSMDLTGFVSNGIKDLLK